MTLSGALALVALVSACGASHTSSSRPPVRSTAPASTAAPQADITRGLLTSSELPAGFAPSGQPTIATNVQVYAKQEQTPATQMASETARLRRLGFVAAASQNLNAGPGAQAGAQGVSLVEQYRSNAGARAELGNQVSSFRSSTGNVATFPVPGIPNAVGFGTPGLGVGVNLAFADGNYFYLVGEAVPNTRTNKQAVIVAAQKLYHRVHT